MFAQEFDVRSHFHFRFSTMAASTVQPDQRPGHWTLDAGQAMTLTPRRAGELRIGSGLVWATFDGPHAGHGNELGDVFLQGGEQVHLAPGQSLVLESRPAHESVLLEWRPQLSA